MERKAARASRISVIRQQRLARNRGYETFDFLFCIEIVDRRANQGVNVAIREIDLCRQAISVGDVYPFFPQARRCVLRCFPALAEGDDSGALLAEIVNANARQGCQLGAQCGRQRCDTLLDGCETEVTRIPYRTCQSNAAGDVTFPGFEATRTILEAIAILT